jgi:hypothetical protein
MELIEIEEKFEQGVLPEIKIDMSEEKPQTKVCRYHSKGACKKGSSCLFLHPTEDCAEYVSEGNCTAYACQKRHREECRYFKRQKGCNRQSCPFIHKYLDNSRNNVQKTEEVDHLMKLNKELNVEVIKTRRGRPR